MFWVCLISLGWCIVLCCICGLFGLSGCCFVCCLFDALLVIGNVSFLVLFACYVICLCFGCLCWFVVLAIVVYLLVLHCCVFLVCVMCTLVLLFDGDLLL